MHFYQTLLSQDQGSEIWSRVVVVTISWIAHPGCILLIHQ